MGDLISMILLECTQKGEVLLSILKYFLSNQLKIFDREVEMKEDIIRLKKRLE